MIAVNMAIMEVLATGARITLAIYQLASVCFLHLYISGITAAQLLHRLRRLSAARVNGATGFIILQRSDTLKSICRKVGDYTVVFNFPSNMFWCNV
jgi:hypothetical protein